MPQVQRLFLSNELEIFEANLEFVKKALIRIGRHYNVTYGKWIIDEGTWSEFVPQAEGKNQREEGQAERNIIVAKYMQRYARMANDRKRRSTYGAAVTTRNDADTASDEGEEVYVTRGAAGEGGAGSGTGGAGSWAGATVESPLQELLLDAPNLLNTRLQPSSQDQPQAQP